MSSVTTYKCDRCANSYTGEIKNMPWQLWKISTKYDYYLMFNITGLYPPAVVEWCRDCMESMGLLTRTKLEPGAPVPEPITIEDIVREIVRCEVQQ